MALPSPPPSPGLALPLALLSALSLCLACPQKDKQAPPPPAVAREKEPNNQASQAQKLSQDTTLEAEISLSPNGRDEDWFELPATPQRWAQVEVTPSPGVDLALELVSPEGEVLLRTHQAGLGGGESIPNVGLGQPRFLRVVSAKDGSGGSYQLKVHFVEATAEHEAEPNNRPSEATPAPLDVLQQGVLFAADDVDWFRLELGSPPGGGEGAPPGNPPGGVSESPTEGGAAAEPTPPVAAAPPTMPTPFHRIALGVEAEPSANVEIQLCDGEGKPLVRTPMGHRGGWVLRNYALPPGLSSVTLSLKNMAPTLPKGQPPSPVPYSLKLSLEANNTSFEMEPNPRPSQATPLAVGGEMEALLSPPEDVDYFRVDVPQPSLLNVTLSALEGVDLQLSAIAPAEAAQETERVLLRSNEGKTQEAERLLNVHCENTCYFKVESVAQKVSGKWTKTQENSKTPYKIGVQLQGDKQRREREPNNLAEQATELPMGQNIRGYVYPKGDVDFFRVDLSTLPLRRPLLATLFGLPKNNLGLWLYRMDAEGKLELVQTAPLPKKDGPTPLRYSATPGVYFLEVKDPKNREANFQDEYQLRVEWDDAP